MGPRIAPVPIGERVGDVAGLLNSARGENTLHDEDPDRPALNVLATMVRNPNLYRPSLALAQYITNGRLPPRDRELTALRCAVNCASEYVWAHHYHAARAAGISTGEIDKVAGSTSEWNQHEKALLDTSDELHIGATVRDETWGVLSGQYAEADLIELVILVGEFRKIACFNNSMRTPVEDWLAPTPPLPALTAVAPRAESGNRATSHISS